MKTAGKAGQVAGAVETQVEVLDLGEGSMLGECLLSLCERQEYLLGMWELSGNCLIQPLSQVIIRLPGTEFLVVFYGEGMCSLLSREKELKKYGKVIIALDRPLDELDEDQNNELKTLMEYFKNLTVFYRSKKTLSTFFYYCLDSPSPSSAFSSLVRLLEQAGKKEDFYFA